MLFLQEMKKIVLSISYILFIIIITFALHSQSVLDFDGEQLVKPQVGGNFGTTNKEIPEIIMPTALEKLWREFLENNYKTYPVGFIKNVKLNDSEQMEIAEIISQITDIDKNIIYKTWTDTKDDTNLNTIPAVRTNMDYTEFKKLMQKSDDILGGGSDYEADSLIVFGSVPVTYEEAVEMYDLTVTKDKITGGYARLFSDYTVAMAASILPIFLAIIMCIKDKSSNMSEIIYTRKMSSAKLIFVRYFSIITAVMVPVIILSYISNFTVWKMYDGIKLDYLAPLKYDFGWIMPSVMIVTALGMCLTELTNTPIAIAVQCIWWLFDINSGIQSVSKSYSIFRLAPRHNAGCKSYFRTQIFVSNFNKLAANRLLFAGLSILLIILTIIIYEAKRKGKLNAHFKFKKSFSNLRNSKN